MMLYPKSVSGPRAPRAGLRRTATLFSLRCGLTAAALLGSAGVAPAQSDPVAIPALSASQAVASELDKILAAPAVGDTATEQAKPDALATPVLREDVRVTGDVVRIGDVLDNAGSFAQIAIYRAPDLGTTGTLSTAELLATLRTYQVYGINTRGIGEITVTHLARTVTSKTIEQKIAHALERRNGVGAASDMSITFDRDIGDLQLDASNTGELHVETVRYDARGGRFDVMFKIANSDTGTPTRLRFTGTAIETVDAAVLVRSVAANEVLKSSDIVTERRPKSEVGNEGTSRDHAVGMQARRALHAGQALRSTDLGNPDLVQRDQMVTLIYDNDGLYLTVRAKALESGTAGDQVSVFNPDSKRTVQGMVSGPGRVSVLIMTPRAIATAAVSTDDKSTATQKAE